MESESILHKMFVLVGLTKMWKEIFINYFVIITCVFFFYSVLINNCKCNVAMFFKIFNLLGLTSDSYE